MISGYCTHQLELKMVSIYISKSGHILLMQINKEENKWGTPQPLPWQPSSK